MTGLAAMVAALLVTCAVEVGAAAALGLRRPAALAGVALANAITNPPLNLALLLAWHLHPGLAHSGAAVAIVAAAEVVVVAVEWIVLRWALAPRRPLAMSLLLNTASAGVGLALWW